MVFCFVGSVLRKKKQEKKEKRSRRSNTHIQMSKNNLAGQSFLQTSSLDQTSADELLLQAKALEELLSVLLSAGYFRARVAALSAFDKVVGGLCWCITSSGIVVDVDVFYDEELALGQKMFVF